MAYRVGIITASDKGAKGERVDGSGPLIKEMVEQQGYEVIALEVVPDDRGELKRTMLKMAEDMKADLILTTGGTGFSQRDVTPEATRDVIEREAPGIAEAMRYQSLKITPKAMLSRGIAGIYKKTLIINLPGSPKAVKENLSFVIEPIYHGLQILIGDTSECGTPIGEPIDAKEV